MSIPPLLSRTPPPICEMSDDDDDDDDFGSFVVNNELVVDISQAPDILDSFEKKTGKRCEDTTSDDSGLCMSSMGQTQSPCDSSPVSSSYIQSNTVESNHNSSNNGFLFSNAAIRTSEDTSLPRCSPDSLTNGLITREDCAELVDPITGGLQTDSLSLENEIINMNLIPNDEADSNIISNTVFSTEGRQLVDNVTNSYSIVDDKFSKIEIDNIQTCEAGRPFEVYKRETADSDEFQPFENFTNCEIIIPNSIDPSLNSVSIERDSENIRNCCAANEVMVESTSPPINGVCSQPSNPSISTVEPALLHELNMIDKSDKNIGLIGEGLSNRLTSENLDEHTSNSTYIPDSLISSEGTDEEFSDFQSSLCDVNYSRVPSVDNSDGQMENLWLQLWSDFQPSPAVIIQLGEELNANKVWIHLRQLDCSPALSYQWPTSASNCKLLSALKIDSRNILFGPWNKFKFSSTEGLAVMDCGKNAGLKDKLETTDVTVTSKDPVPDAHFDWVGSGLVNPLDCVSTTLLDLQLLTFARVSTSKIVSSSLLLSSHSCKEIGEEINCTEIPKLSRKACEVLRTLPDLSFMRKPFIVFPKCTV